MIVESGSVDKQAVLLPCPFCGNPKPVVKRETLDGKIVGFSPTCIPCSVWLTANYVRGEISQRDTRASAIQKWNQRSQAEPPACPLCGCGDLKIWVGPPQKAFMSGFDKVASVLHSSCTDCGLTMVGLRHSMTMAHGYRVHKINVMDAWKKRQGPQDYVSWNDRYEREMAEAWEAQRKEYEVQFRKREREREVSARRAGMVMRALKKKIVIEHLGSWMCFSPTETGVCPGGIAGKMKYGFRFVDAEDGDPLVELKQTDE